MKKNIYCAENQNAKSIITKTVFILLLVVSAVVFAADPPPLVMIKNTSNSMVAELDRHVGNLRNNQPLVAGIVRRILLPRVDVVNMSQNVVGRLHWQSSSLGLQQQFISQFTTYVVRTYATALSTYDGEVINFYPIRGYTPDKAHVQVESVINHKNRPPNRVVYRLVRRGGAWFVYDFSVDGVSFVQNYRSQFAGTLQQGGMSLLVQKLTEKNRAYRY